jgi:hypothetical protein
VVEGVDEVGPIKMSIDTEHLQEYSLADAGKIFGKAAALADPFISTSQEGGVGDAWVRGVRNRLRIGRKELLVVDLARDPALHELHVFMGGQFDGFVAAVQPCV